MNKHIKILGALAGAAALVGSALLAVAQVPVVAYVQSLNLTDAIQDVPNASPSAQAFYANPGWIAAVEQYSYQVPLTAFSITPPNLTSLLYLNPAGTLATGTLTMEAVASDGQKFCVESSQTQTAITIQANTGQSLASYGLSTPTALTANTPYCWFYIKAQAAWVRRS